MTETLPNVVPGVQRLISLAEWNTEGETHHAYQEESAQC